MDGSKDGYTILSKGFASSVQWGGASLTGSWNVQSAYSAIANITSHISLGPH